MFGVGNGPAMTMTPAAATEIKRLMTSSGGKVVGLKLGVKKGGCAGMEYTMEYAEEIGAHDEVVEQDGVTPVAGAELRIIEDAYHFPEKIYGFAITGTDGVGEFDANRIVSVEDCWGVMLNYVLYGQLGERIATDDYNSNLFNAINSETWRTDTTSFPLVLPP